MEMTRLATRREGIGVAEAAPRGRFGVKAYGSWKEFDSVEEFCAYLIEWMSATDGAERNRAVTALVNLRNGISRTDTDAN